MSQKPGTQTSNPFPNLNVLAMPKWTWRDKLRSKLFPFKPCHVPDAPPEFHDALICRVTAELSFMDRLRVLASGRMSFEAKTVTENRIGRHMTAASACPLPTRFLERRGS